MKILIKDNSNNGEVLVRGVYGPKTISKLLELINEDIRNINRSLRALYEQD
jgi:ribosomal protein S28E/S33